MSLLIHLPDRERLHWKFALLHHRPPDLPDRYMAHFVLGALQQEALRGDPTMPDHWETAVLAWRSRGFRPESFLLLHQAVTDLARWGYQVPVAPPASAPPGSVPVGSAPPASAPPASAPTASAQPGSVPVGAAPAPAASAPVPARRTPRAYRSWGGRPGPGPYCLDPAQWAGRGDWVASAIREIVLDVMQERDTAGTAAPPRPE